MLSQVSPRSRPGTPALAFILVVDGDFVASFADPMAAVVVAQRLKWEDLARAVLIMVEEAVPDTDPPDGRLHVRSHRPPC